MVSKPKKRQVAKARPEIQEPPKQDKRKLTPEELIYRNGELVEKLLESEVWKEIVLPVLLERVASVSGRFTNGRFFHGTLTREIKSETSLFLAGYQKALMDFNNDLSDFIDAKNKQLERLKEEKLEKSKETYNPFMESLNEE